VRLLVTGASGFIGRNLLQSVPGDWQVLATFHRSMDFPAFLAAHGLSHVKPVRIDLASESPEAIARAIGPAHDAAVLLAANGDPAYSVRAPREDLAANALSVVSVLEGVRVGRLVYVSSGAVYDHLGGGVHPGVAVYPTLPYAISKLTAERYMHSFTRSGRVGSATAVRFFGAYGPHEPERKIYTRLVKAFAQTRRPEFTVRGNGKNLIDAMYVDDAVRGLLTLVTHPAPAGSSETLDLASGTPLSIEALVRTAAETFGITPEIRFEGEVPEYIEFRSVDPTMAERFRFRPEIPLDEGLRRLARHLASPSPSVAQGPDANGP
jgi:nucleoside-diphosphate-sugar epimerase